MSTERDQLIEIAARDQRVKDAVSRESPSVQSVAAAVIDALGIEQAGWWNDERGAHRVQDKPELGVHEYECFATDVPVFRLRSLDPA